MSATPHSYSGLILRALTIESGMMRRVGPNELRINSRHPIRYDDRRSKCRYFEAPSWQQNGTSAISMTRSGTAAPTRHVHADAWGDTGRGFTSAQGLSPNCLELGASAVGRPAGLASPALGSPRFDGPGAIVQARQDAGHRCDCQRLSVRALDAGAHWPVDRARVRRSVHQWPCLAHRAQTRIHQPAAHRTSDTARRGGDCGREDRVLVGAKETPDEREEPSSSPTSSG